MVRNQSSSKHGLQNIHKLSGRSLASNIALVLTSSVLLIWSFQFIQSQLTTVMSVDAVVNSLITEIRAPEEGVIVEVIPKTGQAIHSGEILFSLENQRASELQVQEISNRLNQRKAELEQAEMRLVQLNSLLSVVSQNAVSQKRLETLENQQNQNQLLSDLEGAKARYQLAQLNHKRTKFLRQEGAIAEANLDAVVIELRQRESEINSLEARLATVQVSQDAVSDGLSLSKTRSNYDPGIRLEELQLRIAEGSQEIQTLKKRIQGTQAELEQAQRDLKRKQTVAIKSHKSGVLWELDVQPGEFVQKGELLGKMVDCEQRWVDAWVDENKVQALQVGTPAEIQLNGIASSTTLSGKVSVIRSGLGRLAAGKDTVVAANPNLPRHTQVRITLNNNGNNTLLMNRQDSNFCYIGFTGRAVFKIQ